jgi:predicted metal-dependent peptidase
MQDDILHLMINQLLQTCQELTMYNAKPLFTTNCTAPVVYFNKAMIKLQELDRASYRFQLVTDVIWTNKVPTAATCGYYTYFNPEAYVDWCENVRQRVFVHAHEIKHIWLRHPQRQMRYVDQGYFCADVPFVLDIWAQAIDFVINADNLAMGMEAPSGICIDERFTRDDNVDQVYMTLIKEYLEEQEKQQSFPPPPSDDEGEDESGDSGDEESDDSGDESQDEGEDEGDSGDSGEGDDESDEDGESAGSGDDEGDEESESESSGESGGDSGDESSDEGEDGSDGDSGGPEYHQHDGHDQHFTPQYEGDPGEQEDAAAEDEQRIKKNVDDAIDDYLSDDHSNHNMGGGMKTAGYRHGDPMNPSGIPWNERVADVMTRPGIGGPVNWGKINRRKFFNTGCVMPTHKGSIDRLVITDDISSSVNDDQWGLFLTEFAHVADMLKPQNGTLVLWTNTEVVRTDVAMSGAELLALEAPRGGANRLRAGSECLRENGITYDLHLIFTDGWTPLEDYQCWAAEGAIVVLDRIPDCWVQEQLDESGCEYIVMDN